MEEILQHLEEKIRKLISQHTKLKENNHQLIYSKANIAVEKEAVLAKQQRAIDQIENLVAKLKAIEELT